MGFDKPDLGFVVHLGAPQSPVAYYQQIGRAGRGVERAEVVLLPGREDRDIWAYFASLAFPPERQVRATLDALADAGRPLSTAAIETQVDLSRGRLESMLKVLDVDGAVTRTTGGWAATGKPWEYDGERYERVARERDREQQAMLAYQATDGCRMEFLRRELDDPEAARVRAVRQLHRPALGRPTSPPAGAEAARERLARPGVTVEPRKMWPTGMKELGIDAAGQDPAAPAGRARPGARPADRHRLGRPRCAPCSSEQAPDGPVTDQLADAMVQVLASWDWAQRPAAVVDDAVADPADADHQPRPADRRHRPAALPGRARLRDARTARGRAGTTAPSGWPPCGGRWSSRRPRRRARVAGDGPVLLVDDQIDTGWTMTVAAMLLRDAGAAGRPAARAGGHYRLRPKADASDLADTCPFS